MSKKQLKQVNKVYHVFMTVVAIALAVTALIHNPAHLVTAGVIYAFGASTDFENSDVDKFDLR